MAFMLNYLQNLELLNNRNNMRIYFMMIDVTKDQNNKYVYNLMKEQSKLLYPEFKPEFHQLIVPVMYVKNRWICGCYDIEEKLGYVNDVIGKNIPKVQKATKHLRSALETILKMKINRSSIDEETEFYENIQGDTGFYILGLIFEQFYDMKKDQVALFKEMIIYLLLKFQQQ